jgi:transposase
MNMAPAIISQCGNSIEESKSTYFPFAFSPISSAGDRGAYPQSNAGQGAPHKLAAIHPCAGLRWRPTGPWSAHPTSVFFIERIFADTGYQGAKTTATIAKTCSWKLEIVKRNAPHRFVVLPKRLIVDRTLGWTDHNPRLARLRARRAIRRRLRSSRHDPHHVQSLTRSARYSWI